MVMPDEVVLVNALSYAGKRQDQEDGLARRFCPAIVVTREVDGVRSEITVDQLSPTRTPPR